MKRIVVGIDGSDESIKALRWAIDEAQLRAATVEAVCAWTYPYAAGDGFGTMAVAFDPKDLAAGAASTLETAIAAACPDPALRATIKRRIVEDRPAHALITESDGAELLVVGSRGHGSFAGLLLGSVSLHVVTHCKCPVVVIRSTGE